MPFGDPVARRTLTPDDESWPIRSLLDGSAAHIVIDGPKTTVWPSGPWTKPPAQAIAMAIPQQGQLRPAGAFIAGLNPFRSFDNDYQSFLALYVGQLAAALATVQAYAAERRRAEALAQIDRAKTAFFSNVSHELWTPLTLMLAPVTDALSSEPQTLVGDSLELVYRNGLRLRKLVNALLEFSRIEAGRVQASFEPVDLAVYTSELASSFESAMQRAGLRYVVEAKAGGEPTYVDREMWEKIVLNLISNAVALLDIGLPVLDGFEVARLIRSNTALSATRLVAVTGYGQEHDRKRTRAAGFDAHLVKPVDIQQVSDLIAELARNGKRPGVPGSYGAK